MAVLIDIEWNETSDSNQAPCQELTQVSALRVGNTWKELDCLNLLVRPKVLQGHEWGFMAFNGYTAEEFCSGKYEGNCVKALFAWIEREEKIFYWCRSTRKILLKVYRRYFHDKEEIFDSSRFVCIEERLSSAMKCPVNGLYETAKEYGIEIAIEHCSACDVKLMQQILRKASIPVRRLEAVHVKEFSLAERRAKNQKIIRKMSCPFVYVPKSEVFHRSDCKLILCANTVKGCAHYAAAAENRRPCKVCKPVMTEADMEMEKSREADLEISRMNEVIKVRLIDGSKISIKRKKLVGCCHNRIHPGCLNEKLMVEHDCLGKQCRYFQAYENASYWIGKQMRQKEKQHIKQQRQERQIQENANAKFLEELKNKFQGYMEAEKYPVQIVYIERIRANTYKVFYVSDNIFADGHLYPNFYRTVMRYHPGFRLLLRHIKDENGYFVTRDEYIRRVGVPR